MTPYPRLNGKKIWEKNIKERDWKYQTPADILIKSAIKNDLNYEKVKNFEEALNKVSSKKRKLIVCFGSLYGAGEILKKN